MALDVRKIPQIEMKYKEIFNMEYLYKALHDWILLEKFVSDKWMETLYLERRAADGSRELWIFWDLTKNPQGNPFYLYKLEIDFHPLGLKDTEVMFEGKKLKAHSGEVVFKIRGFVEFDPDERLKKNIFLGFLSKRMIRRLYKKEIDMHENEMYKFCYRLADFFKQYLQMKGFIEEFEGRTFYPVKGLGE